MRIAAVGGRWTLREFQASGATTVGKPVAATGAESGDTHFFGRTLRTPDRHLRVVICCSLANQTPTLRALL